MSETVTAFPVFGGYLIGGTDKSPAKKSPTKSKKSSPNKSKRNSPTKVVIDENNPISEQTDVNEQRTFGMMNH